jgi:hypothetical protein
VALPWLVEVNPACHALADKGWAANFFALQSGYLMASTDSGVKEERDTGALAAVVAADTPGDHRLHLMGFS